MKTWALKIVVLAALVGVALWLRERGPQDAVTPGGPQKEPAASGPDWAGPSRTVNEFFQAAGDGDDEAYLRLVDGPLRRSLEQNRAELGVEAFRRSLGRSAAGIKGLAVTPAGSASDDSVALDVEIVFADRNEQQRMVLAPKGRRWVITAINQARRIEQAVPYGTPVFGELFAESEEAPVASTGDPQ